MSKKTKIGFVLSSVPGYSETFLISKIKALLNNGFEVFLFVRQPRNKDNFICPVYVHPLFSSNALLRLIQTSFFFFRSIMFSTKPTFRLLELTSKEGMLLRDQFKAVIASCAILRHDLDWLHFGFASPAIERELVGKAIGAKVSVSFRGYDLNQVAIDNPTIYNRLWQNLDQVHSISEDLYERALALGLSNRIQKFIIPPAIDLSKFPFQQQFNWIDRNEVKFLFVSRLHWIKGIEYAFMALSIIKNQGIRIKVTVVGEGTDLERLVFAAYQLRIFEDVKFLGKKEHKDVLSCMQNHHILLQYSHQEGFCNVALEAQAIGLLTIVSDGGALPENVLDQKTGWVVPKRNPEVLAKRIFEILSMPIEELMQIRIQARERIEKDFSLGKQTQAFIEFFSSKD